MKNNLSPMVTNIRKVALTLLKFTIDLFVYLSYLQVIQSDF